VRAKSKNLSKFDCNALLYETSAANIAKLQRLQNTLAQVVTMTRRHDHISPVLSSLHWLPISQRIKFKLATITYKVLVTGQPDNLSSLIHRYNPVRSLRSSFNLGVTNRILIESIQPCSIKNLEFTKACKRTFPSIPNAWQHSKTRNRCNLNVLPLIAADLGRPRNFRHPKSQYAATRHGLFTTTVRVD